jgi:NOL1/NOP2/fmu family ribosome biogenesis protein
MTLKIFSKKETQEIEKKLQEQFGIENIPGILIKRGEERIFLFQGSFNEEEIKKLEKEIPIERIGVYFAKEQNDQIRLSIEGVNLLKEQIKKNIFELDDEQAERWMLGQELPIKTGKRDFLIMKNKEYFLGCGKASEEKIGNFIPKNRRLKYKER